MPDKNTKFVNSLYLKTLIENYYQETDVKVKAYTVEPASPTETGRSSMNRVLVKYTSAETTCGSLSLVMKVKPLDGELSRFYQNSDAFHKEQTVYNVINKDIRAQLKPIAGKLDFVPEIIASATTPSELMVFEDLTLRGYCTESPISGLNYEQCRIALEKLAFFHAATAVLLEKTPETFEAYSKGTFDPAHGTNLKYFSDVLREFANGAESLGFDATIANKFKAIAPKVIAKAIQCYQKNPKEFNVLNHGEFWTNNILFKYEGGQLVDALFIDFQNSVVGSPVIDLLYFLTTSVATDIYFSHRDELIFIYHETLKLILEKLGFQGKVPTLNELQIELLQKGALEVVYVIAAAPFLRCRSKIVPAIQPEFYEDKLDVKEALNVYAAMGYTLKRQVLSLNEKGLLDWGASDSKVKGLMGRFQQR